MKAVAGFLALIVVGLVLCFVIARLIRLLLRLSRKGNGPPAHEELLDAAEDVASASRVAAVVAAFGAFIAAPAGLLAVLATVGVVTAPLIVALAPALATVAVATTGLYAGAKLYAKHRRRRLEALQSPPADPR